MTLARGVDPWFREFPECAGVLLPGKPLKEIQSHAGSGCGCLSVREWTTWFQDRSHLFAREIQWTESQRDLIRVKHHGGFILNVREIIRRIEADGRVLVRIKR
jgi:hypothetical protein